MDQANLDISYVVAQQAVSGLAVSYVINATQASTADLGIAYSISDTTSGTSRDEFAGTWADSTQIAANMLPDWHAGRKGQAGSNYQKFLNASTMQMDDIQEKMIRARRNLHLYTAETKEISKVYASSVTQTAKQAPSKNMLLNSDFTEKRPAIIDQPMHWSTSGSTGSISYADDSLFGGSAVELRAASGESCNLSQNVDLRDVLTKSLTLSAWVKSPVSSSDTASTDHARLQLSVLRMDGTPLSTQVALPVTTSGSWQRVSATVISSSEIYSASCRLEVGSPNNTRTHLTYVGGLQLEEGEVSTSWQQGDNDSPDAPFGVVAFSDSTSKTEGSDTWTQIPGQRVHFIQDEGEFLTTFIPTSISSATTVATPSTSSAELVRGKYHEWTDKRPFTTSYEVSASDSSVINRKLRETDEIYQSFKLAERGIYSDTQWINADSHLENNGAYAQTIKAITILEGNMLALVKDVYTPSGGSEKVAWSIKVVSLNQFPGIDELQVIRDLKIPSNVDMTALESSNGAFNYIGVVTGDPKNLVLSTSGGTPAHVNITVAYDYYTADLNRGQLVTRENYAGNLVIT